MRLGTMLLSLSVCTLVGTSAWADPAPADAPPPPPPAGYPPPPGYVRIAPAERTANNSIYLEGLGPGIFYSVNYDRSFGDFAGRVGFGYLSVSASEGNSTSGASASASFLTIPLTLSYIGVASESKKHMLEVGAGATIIHFGAGASAFDTSSSSSASGGATTAIGVALIGYRMQPADGGFMLRTGIAPLIGGSNAIIPWPYIALGGVF